MKYRKQTTWELYAKTVRMRAAEKRALRERLVSYMEYHPVRVPLQEAPASKLAASTLTSESFVRVRFSSWQFRTFAGVFMLMLLVGVPAFAERAVPGDALYLMKVNVNEEVMASLTWDSADRIAWQAERVERRVAEARLLAKEGKLTDETEATLAATMREHTENASREIAELRVTDAEGAEVAQAALSSTLEVQTAILATDGASTSASTTIDSLALAVEAAKVGVDVHDPTRDAALSSERMDALLETETTRARELFTTIAASVSESERADIERRLIDIERSMQEAQVMHQTGKREQALVLQRTAFGDIEKMVSFMTDLDIRTTVALDTLVPKKLTSEEQTAALSADLESLKNDAVTLRTRRSEVQDASLMVKYDEGYREVERLIEAIEAARTTGDTEAGLVLVLDARALIKDLEIMATVREEVESSLMVTETATTTPTETSTTTE
ncbi:MAG: hypothetical protein RLZZ234_873 [Candidatus Parcubacteria bacterium]|jgi:hypothetical protein